MVDGASVTCAGQPLVPLPSSVTVTGTAVNHSISVSNAQIAPVLSNLSVDAPSPIAVTGSTVALVLAGANALAGGDSRPAVGCAGRSNRTFRAVAGGALSAAAEGPRSARAPARAAPPYRS